MERPLYKVQIDESDETTGVHLVSFVSNPAMEAGWISLSSENPIEIKLNQNDIKQVLTGALIIPNKRILRIDESGEEYDIMFDVDSVWAITKKLNRNKLTNNTNIEHFIPVEGNYMVECWIVEDPKNDKSNALGLGEYPKGTLMMSIHIPDAKLYSEISKQMTGFSLEGIFHHVQITNNKLKSNKMSKNILTKMKEEFMALFSKLENEELPIEKTIEKEIELEVENSSVEEIPVDEIIPVEEKTPVLDNEMATMITDMKSMMEEMKNQLAEMANANMTLSQEKDELSKQVTELSKEPAANVVEALPTNKLSTSTIKKGVEAYEKLMALSKVNPNILK